MLGIRDLNQYTLISSSENLVNHSGVTYLIEPRMLRPFVPAGVVSDGVRLSS